MPCWNVRLVRPDACADCFWTPVLHSEVCRPSPVVAFPPFATLTAAARFRAETAALTDDRIRTMNEVISGIRVIKMYGWEKPFATLVDEVRRYIPFYPHFLHICTDAL